MKALRIETIKCKDYFKHTGNSKEKQTRNSLRAESENNQIDVHA